MDGNEYAAEQLRKKLEGLEGEVKDLKAKVPKDSPPLPVWIVLAVGLLLGILLSRCPDGPRYRHTRLTTTDLPTA
jgi:hypothetical protein